MNGKHSAGTIRPLLFGTAFSILNSNSERPRNPVDQKRISGTKRLFSAFVFCLSLLLLNSTSIPAYPAEIETWDLWTTSPWISSIARYVGGVYVNVHSLRTWDTTGLETEEMGSPPPGASVLAVAPGDLVRKGFNPAGLSIRYLYAQDPVSIVEMEHLFLDPAALPFIGQRVMIGISLFNPEHYSYFQRRLAEFQSRLESTIDVGRKLIGNIRLLDLSWKSSQLIEAAVDSPVSPPAKTRLQWAKGEDLGLLNLTVQEATKQGWLIVTDTWTPPEVLSLVSRASKNVHLPPPRADQELFLFLYDQYLTLWNSVRE